MASIRRKSAAVALAVVGIAGLTLASAAQLTIRSQSLGAGTEFVASCDTNGVDVGFETAYGATGYNATDVNVTDIAATCLNQDIAITLTDASGVVEEVTGTVAGASFTADIADYDAEAITGVSIVIHG